MSPTTQAGRPLWIWVAVNADVLGRSDTTTEFKKTFTLHCSDIGITSQSIPRTPHCTSEVQAYRWIAERTWAWLINHRCLRIDYERDPATAEGYLWAAHARTLPYRLTQKPPKTHHHQKPTRQPLNLFCGIGLLQ